MWVLDYKVLSLLRRCELCDVDSSLTGSLAGAAHLLNDNTGDPRSAQREQKSRVESKGQKLDLTFTSSDEWKL